MNPNQNMTSTKMSVFLKSNIEAFCHLFFFLFRATSVAHVSSWARGRLRAAAASPLPQSELHQIQAASVTYAAVCCNAWPPTSWVRPGIELMSSWTQHLVLTYWATTETLPFCYFFLSLSMLWIWISKIDSPSFHPTLSLTADTSLLTEEPCRAKVSTWLFALVLLLLIFSFRPFQSSDFTKSLGSMPHIQVSSGHVCENAKALIYSPLYLFCSSSLLFLPLPFRDTLFHWLLIKISTPSPPPNVTVLRCFS